MPNGEVTKKNGNGDKKVKYAVIEADDDTLKALVEANLDGRTLTPFDLNKATMPIGGSTAWEVPTLEGSEPSKEIRGVLIFERDVRSFWLSDDMDGQQPDCRSDDAEHGYGVISDAGEPVERECKTCAMSQWGSAGNGSKGQACTLKKILFILQPDTLLPLVVFIPPSSLGVINKWLTNLFSFGKLFYGVELGLSLEKVPGNGAQYSRVVPRVVRELDKKEAEQVKKYRELLIPSLRVKAAEEAGE